MIGFANKILLKFFSPTQVNKLPGGWWFLSKFVNAIKIIKNKGNIVNAKVRMVGIDNIVM